jgi:hypothetical protein
MDKKTIKCGKHGNQRMAFVCQHIFKHTNIGFNEAFPSTQGMKLEEDDDFQAMCDACESALEQKGDFDEEMMAIADIKLVCEGCYFEIKAFNLSK